MAIVLPRNFEVFESCQVDERKEDVTSFPTTLSLKKSAPASVGLYPSEHSIEYRLKNIHSDITR